MDETKTKLEEQPKLTKREAETLQFLSDGLNHEQIAEEMGISRKTISNYCDKIRSKYGNRKMLEIVKLAVQQKIIK